MDAFIPLFIQNAFKHFKSTGSLLPSSRFLARAIAKRIKGDDLNILEVGAGTGAVTKEIAKVLHKNDHLVLSEINKDFIKHLETLLADGGPLGQRASQIELFPYKVQELKGKQTFDYIISSLPFHNFTPSVVQDILDHYDLLLKPNGVVIFFEYKWIQGLKIFFKKKEVIRMDAVEQVINTYLENKEVEEEPVFLNIPPALIYVCRRK